MTSPPAEEALTLQPSNSLSSTFDDGAVEALAQRIDRYNETLARAGHDVRLEYPWMFTVGGGTDPFQRLRTGGRWQVAQPLYILDESDYTKDTRRGETEAALVSAFDTWNALNTFVEALRISGSGKNFDVLDGTFGRGGECVDIFDHKSRSFDAATGIITPQAHIVMGGWLPPRYFVECLGNENILGVTWTFSGPDTDGDQYRDILYVEQFYNEGFEWVTSGSVYLDFQSGLMDIESVAAHENGHALGLGHFGGPVNQQPFTLKPDGRVFNPEAIMNPFYLQGEKRSPFPSDEAALNTLYSGVR